jgi:protein FrlC
MSGIKLAFNTWVYSSYGAVLPSYTLEETIRRIARVGYDGIEIGAGSPHAYPKHLSRERRRDVKRLLVDSGLALSSMLPAPAGGPGYNPASPIPEERLDTIEQYKEVAQLCADWGGQLVLYIPGWPVFGTPQPQAWEWSREVLSAVAKSAADCGVTIAIEPSPTRLVETPDDAIRMMEEVGAPNVKLMFDTIHALTRHEVPADHVHRMGRHLCHLHLSDNDRLVPGQGRGDFVSLIAALKETGFDGYAAMEIGYDKSDVEPDRLAREAYDYIKGLIDADG